MSEETKGEGAGACCKTLRTCAVTFPQQRARIESDKKMASNSVGREAFTALAYMYPDRTVIGVPHPTGAYGDKFTAILPDRRLHRVSKCKVRRVLAEAPGQILSLFDAGNKRSE